MMRVIASAVLPGLKMLPATTVPAYVHDAAIAAPRGWAAGDQHAELVIPTSSLRWTIHLQFRIGRLVDHQPADFATVPEIRDTTGSSQILNQFCSGLSRPSSLLR